MTRTALALITSLSLFATPAGAQLLDLQLSQGGFAGGGLITGSFTGEDQNQDGQLSSFDGEIASFTLNFSGGGGVPAFAFALPQLVGFVWDIGTPLLGDGTGGALAEGLVAEDGMFGYATGAEAVGVAVACDGTQICATISQNGAILLRTTERLQVLPAGGPAPIPEPSLWASMIVGLALAGAAVRARLRAQALASA